MRTIALGALVGVAFVLVAGSTLAQGLQFADPLRLKADGKLIDTGEQVGHSGPCYADFDGDGKLELLVGTFSGHIRVFENEGTREEPKFTDAGRLQAGGKTLEINNW